MNAIKIYLLPFFLVVFFCTPILAQNEIYYEENETVLSLETDSIIENEYVTEKEYNRVHHIKKKKTHLDTEIYYGDKPNNEERKKHAENAGIAAEIIVEVVLNTLYFVSFLFH